MINLSGLVGFTASFFWNVIQKKKQQNIKRIVFTYDVRIVFVQIPRIEMQNTNGNESKYNFFNFFFSFLNFEWIKWISKALE